MKIIKHSNYTYRLELNHAEKEDLAIYAQQINSKPESVIFNLMVQNLAFIADETET